MSPPPNITSATHTPIIIDQSHTRQNTLLLDWFVTRAWPPDHLIVSSEQLRCLWTYSSLEYTLGTVAFDEDITVKLLLVVCILWTKIQSMWMFRARPCPIEVSVRYVTIDHSGEPTCIDVFEVKYVLRIYTTENTEWSIPAQRLALKVTIMARESTSVWFSDDREIQGSLGLSEVFESQALLNLSS